MVSPETAPPKWIKERKGLHSSVRMEFPPSRKGLCSDRPTQWQDTCNRETYWHPSPLCACVDYHHLSYKIQTMCFDPSQFQHPTTAKTSRWFFLYIMHSFFTSPWIRDDAMLIGSVGTVRLKSDSLWEERLQDQVYYSQMIPKWLCQVNYCKLLWHLSPLFS